MVIYERKMQITFTVDEDLGQILHTKHADRKVQSELHDKGVHLIPSYFWNRIETLVDSEKYGFNEHLETTTIYQVTIDDKDAFSCDYQSTALKYVEAMLDNGFNADWSSTETTKKFQEWRKVNGRYMAFNCITDGKSTSSGAYPHLLYDDGTKLDIKFVMTDYDAVLTFKITHEIEKLTNRKKVEQSIVNVPADDMKLIRMAVEEALNNNSSNVIESVVDCSTKILSEANYECSPETVGLVMKNESISKKAL